MEQPIEPQTKTVGGDIPLTNPKPDHQRNGYYTPAVKKAIIAYRGRHTDKYNEFQRNYYHTKKHDEEWNERFKERCREANRRYREKKRENSPPAKIGRPRKVPIEV